MSSYVLVNLLLLILCSMWTESETNLTSEAVLNIASRKYESSWAIQLHNSAKEIDVCFIANNLGLKYRQILRNNYYLLTDENNQDILEEPNVEMTEALKAFPKVTWVEQQTLEDNDVRSFSDHYWGKQEYLKSKPRGFSVNHRVEDVWKSYTGEGVTVAVVDDGVQETHKDLVSNYDHSLSTDIAQGFSETRGRHGTKCAGVIAAMANNSYCGVGVAFDSKIAGIRLFNNLSSTDAQEAQAFYRSEAVNNRVHIFSNSWGPKDNGLAIRAPRKLAAEALEDGTSQGRNGRGSIYVFSAGNGGLFGDSCAFDGYVNSIYTIAVASIEKDGTVPKHAEPCSAVMTAAYSTNLVTASSSDSSDNECDTNFGKTSAAAALVSGILALALQASPNLSWRDVQHLIAQSSTWNGVDDSGKLVRSGNFSVGEYFGFGVLDALTLINKAKKWKSVPEQVKCTLDIVHELGGSQTLPTEKRKVKVNQNNLNCISKLIEGLEHVQLKVDLKYDNRARLAIDVKSPSGTNSRFVHPRSFDSITRRKSYSDLVVTSVQYWGEPVLGEWTVSIKESETTSVKRSGTLFNLTLIFYGTDEVIPGYDSTPVDDDDTESTQTRSTQTTLTTVGVTNEDSTLKTRSTQARLLTSPTTTGSTVGVTVKDSDSSKSMKPWIIAVIVLGCLMVVIIPVIVYFLWRNSTNSTRNYPDEKEMGNKDSYQSKSCHGDKVFV